jgi:hypothetical protein
VRVSAFLRHCRLVTVAAVGAMLTYTASAQTDSESQSPSSGTPISESPASAQTGSESQTQSTGTPGSETQTQSQEAPNADYDRHSRWSRALSMARFDRSNSVLNPDRVLHSVSYGAHALFAGVGQRWHAPCDLFHPARSQHSWFGQSWPWHRGISWLCSSHPSARGNSLPTRRVGRHGENKGCRQWT